MENNLKSKKSINNILNYINIKNNKKKKNVKSDIIKVIELEEIGITDNIANILIKKKITRDEKKLINEYIKEQLNYSYDIQNFDYQSFICVLNLYLYGFENSLVYFRTINTFIKKDLLIKLTLYKNILHNCSHDMVKSDINTIKEFIDNLTNNTNEDIDENFTDNVSTFSYSSEITKSIEIIEREKDILQIENNDLQIKYNELEDKLRLIEARYINIINEKDTKYNNIVEENNKIKKQNDILERRIKTLLSKFTKNDKL